MTAPPNATISPAAWKPVSRAIATACPLLLLVLTVELFAFALVALVPDPVLVAEPLPLAEVELTGQLDVQGMAVVKGRVLISDADAKTGAWDAIAGFGCAPGPWGLSTLSITWMTPLAQRRSAVRSCAELM